jgi:hypothetical protein
MHDITESTYLSLMMALVGWNLSLGQQTLQIDICNTLLKIGYFNAKNEKKIVHFWLTY